MSSEANMIGLKKGGKNYMQQQQQQKAVTTSAKCREILQFIHTVEKLFCFGRWLLSLGAGYGWVGMVILLHILHIKAPCSYLMMWRRKTSCIEAVHACIERAITILFLAHFRRMVRKKRKKKSYFHKKRFFNGMTGDWSSTFIVSRDYVKDGTAASFVITVFVLRNAEFKHCFYSM